MHLRTLNVKILIITVSSSGVFVLYLVYSGEVYGQEQDQIPMYE